MNARRAQILVVEDEPAIRRAVSYALRQAGFEVDCVEDGESALTVGREQLYDVVILDLLLPGVQGIDVCRLLRAESSVPIIVLTARDTETDRVLCLELGADDYVTKPFSTAELVSRVRAILRRRELDRADPRTAIREVGALRLDLARHEVFLDGTLVHLTPSEFKLLALLADEPERVVSRREIVQHLWDSAYVGNESICEVHVSNLRRKLERDRRRPERILTIRGVGYKLVAA